MNTETMPWIDKLLKDDPLLQQRVYEALTDMKKAVNLVAAGGFIQGWLSGMAVQGYQPVYIESQPVKIEVKESTRKD